MAKRDEYSGITGSVVRKFISKAIASAELGIASVEVEGTTITFTFEDETTAEMTFPTPADGEDGEDGVSIVDVDIDANKHLICTLSDGNTVDAGALPMPSLANYYTKSETDSKFNPRNNFKTINGTSIIGTGDIPVSGGGGGEGLTEEAKEALMNCFAHVAWTDEHGQDYYDALAEALGYEPEPVVKTLVSITANIENTTVTQNETYVPIGTVIAEYSDYSTADVTNSAQFSTIDTSSTGAKTLTVTYTEDGIEATDTVTITVTAEPVPVTKVSISATKTKTSYTVGEAFSNDDVVVTMHYSDGTTSVVPHSESDLSIGTVDTSTSGNKTLLIRYDDDGNTLETTITITVTASVEPRGQIALNLVDGKRLYQITGKINDGSNYGADETYHDLRSGMTYTIMGVTTAGHSINVCYYSAQSENSFISFEQSIAQASKVLTIPEGANYLRIGCYTSADINSVTLTESSSEKVLSSITATKVKTQYTQGESFNTDDVSVTALYSNGLSENVTSSAVIGSVDTSTIGDKTLNVSYSEDEVTKTTTITIAVVASGSARGNIPLNLEDNKQLAFSQSGKVVSKDNNAADETFYQVFSGFTYTLTGSTATANTATVCYYSSNNQPSYISYEQITNALGSGTMVLTIPEGANYVRVGCYTMANKSACTLTES